MKQYLQALSTLLLLALLSGCATRPTPLPEEHAHALPWGAIDLDINSNAEYSIKKSLGKILT